ncbi:hypothetical protein JKP88DRAFT_325475 [Tribonema minus]|uniref:Uncharacterized protein n=1 Tax=Tribonema minus TaxID=303371 RepID=A0A836CBZ8_9STRA|nr:hypothetical protein JKP88DRAFT_325475 [Tribonema minus]
MATRASTPLHLRAQGRVLQLFERERQEKYALLEKKEQKKHDLTIRLLSDKDKEKQALYDLKDKEKQALYDLKDKEKQALNDLRVHERVAAQKQVDGLTAKLEAMTGVVLAEQESRNIRGALELVASMKHAKPHVKMPAKQMLLNQLLQDEDWNQVATACARENNVEMEHGEKCFKMIYHTFAKDKHGSEAEVFIRLAEVKAPAERVGLFATFTLYYIDYVVVDFHGNEWRRGMPGGENYFPDRPVQSNSMQI